MSAGIVETRRESLIQEIFSVLGQWPQIERSVFCQAHYQGRSVEAISHSLQLDVEKVHQILKQCDRRLHASLRNPCESGCETHSLPAVGTARPAA